MLWQPPLQPPRKHQLPLHLPPRQPRARLLLRMMPPARNGSR